MDNLVKNNGYFCIFGGGAMRGLSYIGAMQALEELDINITAFAGASIGSVIATSIALGVDVSVLKSELMNINLALFKDLSISVSPDFSFSKGEIFYEKIKDYIEQHFYKSEYKKGENKPVTFKDIPVPLYIYCSNMTDIKQVIFSKETNPDMEVALAVRISAAMPGLMKSVEFGGKVLADGDIFKGKPCWRNDIISIPSESRVLEFRLEGENKHEAAKNPIDYMNQLYTTMTASSTDFIIDLYKDKDKFDYIKINTKNALIIDLNMSEEDRLKLIDIGYDTTIDYFKNVLPKKKKNLINVYNVLYSQIKKIDALLEKNNYLKVKQELGYLFFDLATSKSVIDVEYFNQLVSFKDNYIDNLQKTPLLNIYSLKNQNYLKSKLKVIENNLQEKGKELKAYIKKIGD